MRLLLVEDEIQLSEALNQILTILSKQLIAQNINYKGVRYKQIHGERKNEILIWREH